MVLTKSTTVKKKIIFFIYENKTFYYDYCSMWMTFIDKTKQNVQRKKYYIWLEQSLAFELKLNFLLLSIEFQH